MRLKAFVFTFGILDAGCTDLLLISDFDIAQFIVTSTEF